MALKISNLPCRSAPEPRTDSQLTDVLERIVSGETKAPDLNTLLPWNWVPSSALTIATKA
jgi:hypothetical protein